MFSSSSIVNLCEKSNTSSTQEKGNSEYEYSLCESPDAVEMVSTSSFTYESMGTMATSSPTPPCIHEDNVSSMSPTVMAHTQRLPCTMHTMIEETIIQTSGRVLSGDGDRIGVGKSDDDNTDEDNISSLSSSLNQLCTSDSKSTSASYHSLENTLSSHDKKVKYYHHSRVDEDDCDVSYNVPIVSSRRSITFDYLDHLLDGDSIHSSIEIPVQHVHVESASENMLYCHPEIRLPHANLWEENWLFKKKRKSKNVNNYFTFTSLDFASESVRMFIPNPSQSAQACIGEIPVELLDDLSEKHSPAASLIFSDDDEDEHDQRDVVLDAVDVKAATTTATKETTTTTAATRAIASSDIPLRNKCESEDTTKAVDKQEITNTCNDKTMTQGLTVNGADKLSPFTSRECLGDKVPPNQLDNIKSIKQSRAPLNNQWATRAKSSSPVTTVSPLVRDGCKAKKSTMYPVHQMNKSESVSKSHMDQVPPFVPLAKRMESARSDPSFLTKPCNASVQPNILIQFCCIVKGSKPLGVAWFKGDTLLKDDESFRVFSSGNQYCLEIKETKVDHSDEYSCVVYNANGEQWSDFKLDVKPRSPSVACKREGVHFGCPRAKVTGIKGSSVDAKKNKGQVPNVITQTWAERSQNEKNEADSSVTPTLPKKTSDQVATFTRNGTASRSSKVQFPNSALRNKKYGENASIKIKSNGVLVKDGVSSSSSSPTHGHRSQQKPQQQKEQCALSNDQQYEEIVEGKSTTVVKINDTPVTTISESCRSVSCTSPLVNPSNNLSEFRRDFFVSNGKTADEEALNGVDEKVYHSSKLFNSNNDNDSDTPDAAMTFSLTTSDSGAESVWSRKASSQEDALTPVDLDEVSDDVLQTPRTPSVANLIRQFSRCDTDSLFRSPTFTSTDSIYNDCDGKGIIPRTRSSNNNENNQQVSSSKSYLTLSNLDSSWSRSVTSAVNRKHNHSGVKLPACTSPTASAITSSASNEGYNSDDSAIGGNTGKNSQAKLSVEVLPVNKGSRCITKRASFWQMRCENGLVSDSNVDDTFPSVESAYD